MKETLKWWGLAIVVVVAVLAAIVFWPPKPPISNSLREVADNYNVTVFEPPRSDVELGSTIRLSDQHIMTSGCYVGEVVRRRLAELSSIARDSSKEANLRSQFERWLGAGVDFSRVDKVVATLDDFQEEALINVVPTFDPACLKNGVLPPEPVIGALLRIGSFEIQFFQEDGSRLDLTAAEGSLPAEVTAETGLEINLEGNLKFGGEDLYLGFKKLEPRFERLVDEMTYALGDDGGESSALKYRLYIRELRPEVAPTEVDVRVVNNRIGLEPIELTFEALTRGDVVKLAEIGNLKDFLQVLEIGNEAITVLFERVTFNLEHGVRIVGGA